MQIRLVLNVQNSNDENKRMNVNIVKLKNTNTK